VLVEVELGGGSDDLQAIFERRRRLSETGAAAASASSFEGGHNSSSGGSAGFEASPSYARPVLSSNKPLRVQIPGAPYASTSPPDAKTSPVKPELKNVAIDPALQAAMERRRHLIVEPTDSTEGKSNSEAPSRGGSGPPPQPPQQHRDKRTKDAAIAPTMGGSSSSKRKRNPNVTIPPVPSVHSDDAAIPQDDDDEDDNIAGPSNNEADDAFDDFDQELKDLETPRPAPPLRASQPVPASTRSTRSDDSVLLFLQL
jgi:hypothetical protein